MDVSYVDIIAAIGLTIIVTQSYLFKSFREYLEKKNRYLGKLFKCPMCFGFWSIFPVIFFREFAEIINYGFISSLVCYITYLVIKPLVNKYD